MIYIWLLPVDAVRETGSEAARAVGEWSLGLGGLARVCVLLEGFRE